MDQTELGFDQQDDAAFFSTPGRHGLLQQLTHLLRFSHGLPVVHGEMGGGKSTVARELARLLEQDALVARITVPSGTGFADFLAAVCDSLGVSADNSHSSGELLVALRHFARALEVDRKLGVLIVDDAHQLDDQALGAMVSLLQGEESSGFGFHLVFFSRPGLAARIDKLGLVDVPVYDFDLPLFSPSEMADFLKLHAVELNPEDLSSDVVQSIWGGSRGAPGRALAMVHKRLDESRSDVQKDSAGRGWWSGLPVGHMGALATLVVVLVWALWANTGDDDPPNSAVPDEEVVAEPEATSPAGGKQTQSESVTVLPEFDVPSREQLERSQELLEGGDGQTGSLSTESASRQSGVSGTPASEPATLSSDREDAGGAAQAVSAVPPTAAEESPAATSPAPAPTKRAAGQDDGIAGGVGDLVQLGEDYLLSQSEDSYTLQVLAASNREGLLSFILEQPNRDELHIYQGLREGRRLYVVVTGVYPTRAAASQAVQSLPPRQRDAGPWPRKLSSVHQDIEENRRN